MNNPSYGRRFARENKPHQDEHRTNFHIRVPQVRVVKDDEQLGIMSTDQARRLAQDEGLDLVELVPNAKPPVCRIMDYGRFKYEQNIKKKEAAKKQRDSQVQLKEIRLRPGIADHDVGIKVEQAKKFFADGCKVQFVLQFRGHRELTLKEQGFRVMQRVIEMLSESVSIERSPSMEGKFITCVFAPKP
jgi:translation initiation factor IF-3